MGENPVLQIVYLKLKDQVRMSPEHEKLEEGEKTKEREKNVVQVKVGRRRKQGHQ